MSQLFDFAGDNEFCNRSMLYSNPKDASIYMSYSHVDVYLPPRKRRRVGASFVFPLSNLKCKERLSIDVLPDECLFEILRRLPGSDRSACSGVSKRWLFSLSNIRKGELCSLQAPSKEEDQFAARSLEGKKASDVTLAAIAVQTVGHGGLDKISIRGGGASNIGLRCVARGSPSLKELTLWNLSNIDDGGLLEIASACHHLEKLDLIQCPRVTNRGISAISKSCPKLTDVSLESCPGIGNEALQSIGDHCGNLKSLSVKNCGLISDHGISCVVSSSTLSLSKVKLQSLNISDVSLAVIGYYGKAITDLTLLNLAKPSERGFWVMANGEGLQKLKSLTIQSCNGVTDVTLEASGKGFPNLKSLTLRKCAFVSDNGVVAFTKGSLSVEALHIEECHRLTHYGVFGSLINCSNKLKSLAVVNCFGIQDLGPPLPMLSPCQSLRSLSVQNCPGFGDKCVAFLGFLCPQLQNIELVGLHGLTDTGLLPLIKNSQAGLVKVNLSGCGNLTDCVVAAVAQLHGNTLETLNLENCRGLSDACLENVGRNCKCLSDLDVSKCGVTDAGIAMLAGSNGLNLQILSVSGCSMVSDISIPWLIKLGRTLVGLNVQHCNGISVSSVNLLVDRLYLCDICA